jgi:hypothetical protein
MSDTELIAELHKALEGKSVLLMNANQEIERLTEQQDRLIKSIVPLEYWKGISECDCSNPLPQGGCLRCDLERIIKTLNESKP